MGSAPDWRDTLVAHWQRPQPSLLSRALQPLSWLYGAAAAIDRALYDVGLRQPERAPRPLIVVGNLLAGGAGKTPTVIALVELLRQLGRRPGVISRGYGRQGDAVLVVDDRSTAAAVGDEPVLIHRRARVPVAVSRQRIDAAHALCASAPDVDLLIADDGLQHHALARDLQIIVFDARGAGNGLLLPAGPLRQPLPQRAPPKSLVLYTDGPPSTALPGYQATRRLAGAVSLAAWWAGAPADPEALHALRERDVVACAATARPERFFEMLEREGLRPRRLPRPDHDPYRRIPWPPGTRDVVVTEKDAVKLHPDRVDGAQVWVAPLDLHFGADFGPALTALLPPPKPTP